LVVCASVSADEPHSIVTPIPIASHFIESPFFQLCLKGPD
jgi:hypothetical protein